MDLEKLKKKRGELKQQLREIDLKIRELEHAKDRQELVKTARLITQSGLSLSQILALNNRKKGAGNA